MEVTMDLRKELVLFARLAWDRRLTESTGGNMSVAWDRRLTESTGGNMSVRNGDHFVITPTTMVKHFLTEEDLVEVDLNGRKVSGRREGIQDAFEDLQRV